MKKLITPLLIGLLLSLVSCNNKRWLSIEKRHYNKGYYVNTGRNANTTASAEPREAKKAEKRKSAEKQAVAAEPGLNIKVLPEPEKTANAIPGTGNRNSNPVYASRNHANETKTAAVTHKKTAIVPFTLKQTQALLKSSPRATEDDVLSLLWILILALLVIWAIAFLTGGWGLGGLVHLILVIAVILFVLWILKII